MSSEYARGGSLNRLSWVSRKAPGTPQSLEALFEMIKSERHNTGPFKFARSMFPYLTDDELWQAFGLWVEGRFDSSVIQKKEAWERKKPL